MLFLSRGQFRAPENQYFYIVFESGHLIGAELQTHQVGARCAQFQGRFLADFYATVVPRDPGGNAKFGKIFGLG